MHYDLDVVIVGAGFAGVYLLHQLRKEGLKVKIVEAGTGLGGVWHWNSYPGAQTDTPVPTYSLNIPEVYQTWTWSELYPGEQELKAYFRHIDSVLGLSKDVIYGEKVTRAGFNESNDTWHIETHQRTTLKAQFFCPCLGFATKSYIPDWPGLKDDYSGLILHPNRWPSGGVDLKGKKVAVVGTGATGLQISQEAARDAAQLTCFIRTPNLSWPVRREKITPEQAEKDRSLLEYQLGTKRFTTVGGFLYEETERVLADDTPEQRAVRFEDAYSVGGFYLFFCAYINVLGDKEGNDDLYNFWRRKTHERMTDKRKAEILAPLKSPHPFAAKRTALESGYYEKMDKPHVTLIDVKDNPVTQATENGLVTADGTVHEADIIVMATGYDAVTGGFKDIDITGLGGLTLEEKWKDSTTSYLGLMVSGFPNMFYAYGPLSPTAYASGPAVVESQAHWMVDTMRKMRKQGATRINTTTEAEAEWRGKINMIHAYTLRENIPNSWYTGGNVPGKRHETLIFAGGLPMYRKEIWDAITPDWRGFTLEPGQNPTSAETFMEKVQTHVQEMSVEAKA